MVDLGKESRPEKSVIYNRVLRGFGKVVFILRMILASLWLPKIEIASSARRGGSCQNCARRLYRNYPSLSRMPTNKKSPSSAKATPS